MPCACVTTFQAYSLTQGGALWFTDLTAPDPYYGLPILCALATMGMVQYGMNLDGTNTVTMGGAQQAKYIK
jgi:YidC/Oxa1 family membrane protein insertase